VSHEKPTKIKGGGANTGRQKGEGLGSHVKKGRSLQNEKGRLGGGGSNVRDKKNPLPLSREKEKKGPADEPSRKRGKFPKERGGETKKRGERVCFLKKGHWKARLRYAGGAKKGHVCEGERELGNRQGRKRYLRGKKRKKRGGGLGL